MLSVMLFSEAPIVLAALESCVTVIPEMTVSARVGTIDSLITAAKATKPDILLLDFEPSHFVGITELHRIAPTAMIVLWTRELSVEIAYEAMHAGVRGLLSKSIGPADLTVALTRIAKGEICLDSSMNAQLLTTQPVRLTKRESQMMALLVQGLKNKEIAAALNITEGSVKIYLSRLYGKVGAKDRYDMALYGLKHKDLISRWSPAPERSSPRAPHSHVVFRPLNV